MQKNIKKKGIEIVVMYKNKHWMEVNMKDSCEDEGYGLKVPGP